MTLENVQQWLDHTKSVSSFRTAIRAQVRRLWQGDGTLFSFLDGMNFVISRELTAAWNEGAATCGISEEELTPQETRARDDLINSQFQFLLGFGDAIEENSQASGGELGPLFDRAEMWVNRYEEAKERGKAMACVDSKGIWRVGPTEHCSSCAGFNGRVYRYSIWEANGALPRTRVLCCKGYRCQCTIERTTDRITPGPFPRGLLCG